MELKFEVSTRVARPVHEVFEAVVDPADHHKENEPASYPSMVWGCNYGNCTKDSPFPKKVSELAGLESVFPAGSVAVADGMTGIYPAELPGGWRVIGRTPVTLFDPRRDPPVYLVPGDSVRFEPIAADAWKRHVGPPGDW